MVPFFVVSKVLKWEDSEYLREYHFNQKPILFDSFFNLTYLCKQQIFFTLLLFTLMNLQVVHYEVFEWELRFQVFSCLILFKILIPERVNVVVIEYL